MLQEKVNGQLEQSVQENKILRQKLANAEARMNSEIQLPGDPMIFGKSWCLSLCDLKENIKRMDILKLLQSCTH